jgi:hypothetical protein
MDPLEKRAPRASKGDTQERSRVSKSREAPPKRPTDGRTERRQSVLEADERPRELLRGSALGTELSVRGFGPWSELLSVDLNEKNDLPKAVEVELVSVSRNIPLGALLKLKVSGAVNIDGSGKFGGDARIGAGIGLPGVDFDAVTVFVGYDLDDKEVFVGVSMFNAEYKSADAPRRAVEALREWRSAAERAWSEPYSDPKPFPLLLP